MPLSQYSITNAKAKAAPYMLTDGDGLHLFIYTSGSRLWRLRYRFGGKANMMSLGSFPAVTAAGSQAENGSSCAGGAKRSNSTRGGQTRGAAASEATGANSFSRSDLNRDRYVISFVP